MGRSDTVPLPYSFQLHGLTGRYSRIRHLGETRHPMHTAERLETHLPPTGVVGPLQEGL